MIGRGHISPKPWVRIASSVQALEPNPSEARSGLGAGGARLQTIITQRERGDIGSVCFRSIRLSPRLHAGSDAYPGAIFIFLCAGYSTHKRFVLGGEECASLSHVKHLSQVKHLWHI